jgi:hypothetical protein
VDWLPEFAREVRDLEFGQVAGLVNLLGMLAIIRLAPTVSLADRAMWAMLLFIESRRKYKAAKRGILYQPHIRGRLPRPERFARRKNFAYIGAFFVLCVSVLKVLAG